MKKNCIQEDEIDLRELFLTLWAKKVFIIMFTMVVTLGAVGYVTLKKTVPLYEGSVLIEIGEIQSETFGSQILDNPENLIQILKVNGISADAPKRTNRILKVSFTSQNKNSIVDKLQKNVKLILERHKKKAKFYKNIIMTQQVGEIEVSSQPINKSKKKLIIAVTFVTGFILSVLLVFFMQFVKSFKEEK